jgi:NhaP-type Na+/H+ or K+/H+ antiporter
VAPEPLAPSHCDHLKLSWSRAFSGRGHILVKSRHHVGFVAEVISDIMETAIFCYLGVFLFNDNNTWDWKLNSVAILGCVASRFGMVVAISLLINMFVFCDVETVVCGSFRRMWSDLCAGRDHNALSTRNTLTTMSAPLLSNYVDPPTGEEESEEGDDDPEASVNKRFLDVKTQAMLLLAGVRGAVSFALVSNIPLYDTVTKRGSQYKHELKAMTSASIIFTLFVFGALTYIIVRKDQANPNRERFAGNFTHRLASLPLASDNEGEEEEEGSDAGPDTSLMLEMEPETPRRLRFS